MAQTQTEHHSAQQSAGTAPGGAPNPGGSASQASQKTSAEGLAAMPGKAADQIAETAERLSNEMVREARETAQNAAEDRRRRAERYLNSVSDAIDAGCEKLEEDGLDNTAHYTRMAAARLRDVSGRLDSTSVHRMTTRVEDFIRDRPVVSLGSALLLGFAAIQMLKAADRPRR